MHLKPCGTPSWPAWHTTGSMPLTTCLLSVFVIARFLALGAGTLERAGPALAGIGSAAQNSRTVRRWPTTLAFLGKDFKSSVALPSKPGGRRAQGRFEQIGCCFRGRLIAVVRPDGRHPGHNTCPSSVAFLGRQRLPACRRESCACSSRARDAGRLCRGPPGRDSMRCDRCAACSGGHCGSSAAGTEPSAYVLSVFIAAHVIA